MGINISSGDIVGILHSDDFYENDDVIYDVVDVFRETQADLVYGDLVYVSKNNQNRKLRDWKAGEFLEKNIKKGWMPPHPAVFVKKIFEIIGNYNTDYKISSDYDFLIKALINTKLKNT